MSASVSGVCCAMMLHQDRTRRALVQRPKVSKHHLGTIVDNLRSDYFGIVGHGKYSPRDLQMSVVTPCYELSYQFLRRFYDLEHQVDAVFSDIEDNPGILATHRQAECSTDGLLDVLVNPGDRLGM